MLLSGRSATSSFMQGERRSLDGGLGYSKSVNFLFQLLDHFTSTNQILHEMSPVSYWEGGGVTDCTGW